MLLQWAMKNQLTSRTRAVGFGCLLLLFVWASEVSAQYSAAGAFATSGYRGRTPLSVNYTLDMPPTLAMGSVEITISDLSGPSKADRNLEIVVYVKEWGRRNCIAYRKALQLAEGATTAQLSIPFPCTQSQIAWDVGVFEDGRDIEDTRRPKNNQASYHWYHSNQWNGVAIIGCLQASAADDATQAATTKVFSDYAAAQYAKANVKNQQIAMPGGTIVNTARLLLANDASGDWRSYFAYPAWFVTADAMREINDSLPQVAEALRTYVSAGGMLAVYDAQSPEAYQAANRLLGCPEAYATHWEAYSDSEFGEWTVRATGAKDAIRSNAETDQKSGAKAATTAAGNAPISTFAELFSKQKVLIRPFARGSVLVTRKSASELLVALDGVLMNTGVRYTRTLPDLTAAARDENWFWQNLILEVGKPPVLVFCIMVTLFSAVLGPGLLYFTGRIQRRSLMIFLVPAVSLLATLAIVLYGVLHEGFETYVRVHSVTAYDAPSQVAFGWSRQNYFSGLPSREGLSFPRDAYVRPVQANEGTRYSNDPDPRMNMDGMVSFAAVQTWKSWLKPRQHQQLLVGHRVDSSTIPISTEAGVSGGLLLKNLTDTTLPFVVLRGAADDYYITTDLGPMKSVDLLPQDRDSVAVIVGRVGADFKPVVPPELASGSDSLLNFGRSRGSRVAYQTQSDIIGEALKVFMTDDIELNRYGFVTLVPEFDAIAIPLKGIQSDNVNLAIGVAPW